MITSADQKFVSKCDFVGLYRKVTLQECFLNACIYKGTVANFHSNICSVRKCIGKDLQLQGEDPGWDIYISSGLKIKLHVLSWCKVEADVTQ